MMKRTLPPLKTWEHGFTLVELIVASAILVTMFAFLLALGNQTTRMWASTTGKVEQFREAREAFDRMTTRISQATLNTYWDYDNPTRPSRYERRSELRFLSGPIRELLPNTGTGTRVGHGIFFHAPLGITNQNEVRGLENLLNTWGYYIEFGDDRSTRPPFVTEAISPPRWTWRLMEAGQPTENLQIYRHTSGITGTQARSRSYTGKEWIGAGGPVLPARPLAENVVALVITPRLARAEEVPLRGSRVDFSPLAPNYRYDSTAQSNNAQLNPRNQLPPVVQITMVALDSRSADKLNLDSSKGDLFNVSRMFLSTADYTEDLSLESSRADSLEKQLVKRGLSYRVFTTNVHIRGAKWSREQTN